MDIVLLWKMMTIRSEAEQPTEQPWKILLAVFEKQSSIYLFQDVMGLHDLHNLSTVRPSQWPQQFLQNPYYVFQWIPWTPVDQDFSQNYWLSPFSLPAIIVVAEQCLQIQKSQSHLPLLSLNHTAISALNQYFPSLFLLWYEEDFAISQCSKDWCSRHTLL